MSRFALSLVLLVAAIALPAPASAQQSGSIDRLEPYQSKRDGTLFLRVTARGVGPLDLYAMPASLPCTTVATWTPAPGTRKFEWLGGQSGSGPITVEDDRQTLRRGDGPVRRICLLGEDDVVVAEHLLDLSHLERVSEREAVRWLREMLDCDEDGKCGKARNLFINCDRRSSSEFRCFARWRARNKLTGKERVTWLHHRFRVSGKMDDDGVVRVTGRRYSVGRGNGRP